MERAAYLEWMLHTTPAAVRASVPTPALRQAIEEEFAAAWSKHVESRAELRRYAEACPVPGTRPVDYALREVALSEEASVIAGIHFFSGDSRRPFVGIYAQSRGLTPRQIQSASLELREAWAPFAPRAVQWWAPRPLELRGLRGARGDQRWVVGPLGEIASRPAPALPDGLRLIEEPDARCHAEYARIHQARIPDQPQWQSCVPLQDEAHLQQCAQNRGLYSLRDRGRMAGLIAARPERIRGALAWVVSAQILDVPYRGRGLAAALQSAFLARLDLSRGLLVSGTIDDRNTPALRTAQRCGRKDVGGWVFVSGDGSDPALSECSPPQAEPPA